MELGANENSIRYTLSTFGNYITEHSWGQRLLSVKKNENPTHDTFVSLALSSDVLLGSDI